MKFVGRWNDDRGQWDDWKCESCGVDISAPKDSKPIHICEKPKWKNNDSNVGKSDDK